MPITEAASGSSGLRDECAAARVGGIKEIGLAAIGTVPSSGINDHGVGSGRIVKELCKTSRAGLKRGLVRERGVPGIRIAAELGHSARTAGVSTQVGKGGQGAGSRGVQEGDITAIGNESLNRVRIVRNPGTANFENG